MNQKPQKVQTPLLCQQGLGDGLGKNALKERTGLLADLSARFVVEQLHQKAFTGSLILTHREKKKKIWFYRGEIFRIQSNLVPELIGQMFIHRHFISEEELKLCLRLQKDLLSKSQVNRKIGSYLQEIHSIDAEDIEEVYKQQKISSLLQSLTWNDGEYEVTPLKLQHAQKPLTSYKNLLRSLQSIIELGDPQLGHLFQGMHLWQPKSSAIDLGLTPMWSIIAGCRSTMANGILSVRKKSRLIEIVFKHGLPLTFYEGTVGQPRQTIVVRQASDEHELFFIEQIFQLFSFVTGSAYFRSIETPSPEVSDVEVESHLQFREDKETIVTKGTRTSRVPTDLENHLKNQKFDFATKLKTLITGLFSKHR